MEHVAGVGMVSILKENDYSMEQGGRSVHHRAGGLDSYAAAATAAAATNTRRQVAGRDYDHIHFCIKVGHAWDTTIASEEDFN